MAQGNEDRGGLVENGKWRENVETQMNVATVYLFMFLVSVLTQFITTIINYRHCKSAGFVRKDQTNILTREN